MPLNLRHSKVWALAALVACLGLACLAYYPGLRGGFLFDDFANLPSLGAFGPIDNIATFLQYITSGSADPTGRPIALLTFLLDGNDWPTDPYPFQRTALILHLLNGCLLAWLLLILGRILKCSETQAAFAAMLGAALWLLHPLFVSTTLYIVQREAMLPATFILLALMGYLAGRERARQGKRIGLTLAVLSICFGTLLAGLSKANGGLLPLFALLIELLILTPNRPVEHKRTRHAFVVIRWLFLLIPSGLIFAYLLAMTYSGFAHGMPAIRPWTLGQRLLTEARILIDYLALLWIPRSYTAGLFNDAFPLSTGLLSPPSTLLSLLTIASLLSLAWIVRRGAPALALAIAFFFAGHLIESTVVPLELYFEHRNYVPALFMFWPLALWICGNVENNSKLRNREVKRSPIDVVRIMLMFVLPLGLAALTWQRADLWGNTREQALIWAEKNPTSPRAQAYAAQIELANDQAHSATERLEKALERNTDEIQLALNLIGAKCQTLSLTPTDLQKAQEALRTTSNAGRLGYEWFQRGIVTADDKSCPGLDFDALKSLLAAASQNPRTEKVPGRVQDRLHLQGRIALIEGDSAQALDFFNKALDADIRPGVALEQAAILASAGQQILAERHLDHLNTGWKDDAKLGFSMPSIHNWILFRQHYWPNEIDHLRKVLDEDIARGKHDETKSNAS
jgi:tetratricopeptide (TPR) repeat protein